MRETCGNSVAINGLEVWHLQALGKAKIFWAWTVRDNSWYRNLLSWPGLGMLGKSPV